MKGVGMLVVSLRGVNLGFWSPLECSRQNIACEQALCLGKKIARKGKGNSLLDQRPVHRLGKTPLHLAVKVSFRVALEEILKNYIFSNRFIYSIHVMKV